MAGQTSMLGMPPQMVGATEGRVRSGSPGDRAAWPRYAESTPETGQAVGEGHNPGDGIVRRPCPYGLAYSRNKLGFSRRVAAAGIFTNRPARWRKKALPGTRERGVGGDTLLTKCGGDELAERGHSRPPQETAEGKIGNGHSHPIRPLKLLARRGRPRSSQRKYRKMPDAGSTPAASKMRA